MGKADIPLLLDQAAPHPLRLQFQKAGFQEAKQKSGAEGSRCCGGMLMLAGEQTCVCGTLCVTEPSLVLEVQATQQIIRD